jgi:hypothetical protein
MSEIQIMIESQKINISALKELIRQAGVEVPNRARIFNDLFMKVCDVNKKTFAMLEKEKEDVVMKIQTEFHDFLMKGSFYNNVFV